MSDIRSFFKSNKLAAKDSSSLGQKKTPYKTPNKESTAKVEKKSKLNAPKQRTKSSERKEKHDNSEEVPKKSKKTKRIVIESDSDEEPLPQPLRKSKKHSEDESQHDKKKSKKDKEKSKQQSTSEEETSKVKSPSREKVQKLKVPEKPKLKPVNVDDFFGATPPPPDKNSKSSITTKKEKSKKEVEVSSPKKEKSKKEVEISSPKKEKSKMEVEISSPKKEKKREKIEISSPRKKKEESKEVEETSSKRKRKIESELSPSPKKTKIDSEISSSQKKTKIDSEISSSPKKKSSTLSNKLSEKLKNQKEDHLEKNKESKTHVKEKTSPKKKVKGTDLEIVDKDIKKKHKESTNASASQKSVKAPETPATSKSKAPETPQSNVKNKSNDIQTPQSVENKKKGYWAYKQRDGPSALGSKEIPKAAENCLQGVTFVITGVLEAFERDEFVDVIQRYGGKVTSAVSGKTSYLIVGREPGQSKIDKAAKHKTKQIDEDGFIELLKSKPPKNNVTSPNKSNKIKSPEKSSKEDLKKSSKTDSPSNKLPPKEVKSSPFMKKENEDSQHSKYSSPSLSQKTMSPMVSTQGSENSQTAGSAGRSSMLWVDKYKPKTMKNIVGQQGDKSNANKLKKWLLNWRSNNDPNKPKGNYFAGKEDGSIFKAALLSGPPGVGKTTTATIVCKDVGFEFVELNASDTRGKKALETIVKESLSNTTVTGMLQGNREEASNHVLIMDEVDGMAGNADRGGMQELIQLIKKSKTPIICMCNDRNSPKVRSLANYCFDLRFYRPRVEQIKGFALSVAAREGLKIPPQAMEQIVVGTNQDIRQVLHNLQMWTANTNTLSYDDAKENAKQASKNIKLGPFDIVKQLLTHNDASKLSIHQKTDLFFMDYSFIPLFIQENYPSANPAEGRGDIHKTLKLLSETADAIADSNLVEKSIRSGQDWSLLPLQGFYSTVLPSTKMAGYIGQKIEFPQWLGKNSSRGKHDRILQELKVHMAVSSNCMKTDINLDYLPILKERLTEPLIRKNNDDVNSAVNDVISLLNAYDLSRQDWESIIEIGKYGKEIDIMSKIPTKVKSTFTRLFNKESHMTPYATQQTAKRSRGAATANDDILPDDDDNTGAMEEEDEDDDVTKDAMIKVNTKKKQNKNSSSNKGASNSKAKAPAKKQSKSKAKR